VAVEIAGVKQSDAGGFGGGGRSEGEKKQERGKKREGKSFHGKLPESLRLPTK
jgi:hypothetical protein